MDDHVNCECKVALFSPPVVDNAVTTLPPASLSVLILDDDALVLQLLATFIERLGHRAIVTQTAEAFFAAAQTLPVDFMIVDLRMPGRDGLDILRHLDPACSARIIITSGSGARVLDAVRQSAESYGLDVAGWLGKPFRIADLRALLVRKPKPQAFPEVAPRSVCREEAPSIADLRLALQRDEILAHFQPKVCAVSGAPLGFEALARWQHPRLGMLRPAMFLPLVAQAALDMELTLRIFDQACGLLAALRNQILHVSVNLSPSLCGNPLLLDHLRALLGRHRVSAERLYLEVTETGAEELGQDEVDLLTHLRLNGFRLSIDDFGTGQSSLRRLLKVPFDEVKIDRGFVEQVRRSKATRDVVQGVVRMAKSLGMTVTAEGIEDDPTLAILRKLGCDLVQGYGILRPVPHDAALAWLARQPSQRAVQPVLRGA